MSHLSASSLIFMKILIADDSRMIRDRLKNLIVDISGATLIGEATDAQEVIEETRILEPDLVILDFQIPGGTGLTTLQTIKALPCHPLVLVLTACASPEYRLKCLQAGADYFFDKAFEIDKVQESLLQLIQ